MCKHHCHCCTALGPVVAVGPRLLSANAPHYPAIIPGSAFTQISTNVHYWTHFDQLLRNRYPILLPFQHTHMIGHSLIIIREYSSHCRDLLLGIRWQQGWYRMIWSTGTISLSITFPVPREFTWKYCPRDNISWYTPKDEYQVHWNTPLKINWAEKRRPL